MLSSCCVAVERVERVGALRFFKTLLALLRRAFDLRDAGCACAGWTVASLIKACAALECRGVDCAAIHSALADGSNFVIEHLQTRCGPGAVCIQHCAQLFLFGLRIIFPRLVNLSASFSGRGIRFQELAKGVQECLRDDAFQDLREPSLHALWSLTWSLRFQQRVHVAERIGVCCHQLTRIAGSSAAGASSTARLSPISLLLLTKIVAALPSALQAGAQLLHELDALRQCIASLMESVNRIKIATNSNRIKVCVSGFGVWGLGFGVFV